jgi:hypothetical protein
MAGLVQIVMYIWSWETWYCKFSHDGAEKLQAEASGTRGMQISSRVTGMLLNCPGTFYRKWHQIFNWIIKQLGMCHILTFETTSFIKILLNKHVT